MQKNISIKYCILLFASKFEQYYAIKCVFKFNFVFYALFVVFFCKLEIYICSFWIIIEIVLS